MIYPVLYNNDKIGNVIVEKQSGFYIFEVHCKLISEGIFRCYFNDDNNSILIGVLEPKGNELCINRKISALQVTPITDKAKFYISDNKDVSKIEEELKSVDLNKSDEFVSETDDEKKETDRNLKFIFDSKKEFQYNYAFSVYKIIYEDDKLYVLLDKNKIEAH